MERVNEVYKYIDDHFEEHLEMARNFFKIPCISLTDTAEGREQVLRGAEAALKMIQDLGAEDVKLVQTDGFPVAYGKVMSKNPDAKTLIVYCFYDVMPVREKEWKFPPFEARVVDAQEIDLPAKLGKVVCARAAHNQKGPLVGFVNGVKSVQAVTGDVPVNMLIVFEGEEELMSMHLPQFVGKYKDVLKEAQGLVSATMWQDIEGGTRMLLGCKGIISGELRIQGGEWGGPAERALFTADDAWVDAPIWRLVWALNSLKDPSGKVLIDGFYDDVRPPTLEEKELLEKVKAKMDFENEMKILGIKKWRRGLPGEDLLEDYIMGTLVNIDGIEGGYTGPRIKTNLPRSAYAKFDIRLVPNQSPDDILLKLRKHLYTHGFPEVEIHVQNKYNWYRTPPSADIAQAAIDAVRKHGMEPELWPTGVFSMPSSIIAGPVGLQERVLGYGLGHGGRYHSVNEYMTVEGLKLCEKSWATFLYEYAKT